MTTETKKRFSVINGGKQEGKYSIVTNPINSRAQYLREKLAMFSSEESGVKFSIENLLKW